MKILFICGGMEPGKNGVGDYIRRLAGELIRQGHQVAVMAINDRYVNTIIQKQQQDGQESICVLRFPSHMPWNDRLYKAKYFLENFHADWLSLQYVPHSFHDKGIPLALCKFLEKIQTKGVKWHFMLHELWVGELKTESFKFQIIRIIEQFILKKIIIKLDPKLIHTSNELYRNFLLYRLDLDAKILPVFSNINVIDKMTELNFNSDNLFVKNIKNDRNKYFIVTNFGSYYYKWWDIKNAISELKKKAELKGKELLLVSLGKISSEEKKHWDEFSKITKTLILGIQSEENIIAWLYYYTDMGIVTTPYLLLNKSGSFQALKSCNVPTLVLKKSWLYRLPITVDQSEADYFFLEEDQKIIKNEEKIFVDSALVSITKNLIDDMKQFEDE